MVFVAKFMSFIAFVVACAWFYFSPGFDSGAATMAGLAAFFASFFLKKNEAPLSQVQTVSGKSKATQAGRDVNIQK